MHDLKKTYVHRGDAERLERRIRSGFIVAGFAAVSLLAARNWEPNVASGATVKVVGQRAEFQRLQQELEVAKEEVEVATAQLERWNRVFHFSSRFNVNAGLAAAIFDNAVAEKIDPELAFRLVKLESRFLEKATSPVGAVGLTQLMLPTARYFQKGLTREQLYDRQTNLRIGFRYLRGLIKEQRGDVQMALLVYNRGPTAVLAARELGVDPSNGYDRVVMRGYKGKGILD